MTMKVLRFSRWPGGDLRETYASWQKHGTARSRVKGVTAGWLVGSSSRAGQRRFTVLSRDQSVPSQRYSGKCNTGTLIERIIRLERTKWLPSCLQIRSIAFGSYEYNKKKNRWGIQHPSPACRTMIGPSKIIKGLARAREWTLKDDINQKTSRQRDINANTISVSSTLGQFNSSDSSKIFGNPLKKRLNF